MLSIVEFIAKMAAMAAAIDAESRHALDEAAKVVKKEAKAEIGTYQGAAGPFAAWAPLADTTLDGWHGHPGKVALGYAPPDNPLLRDGTLRDSIEHTVHDAHHASVGSNSKIAVYQEMGTSRMPPRSFLGGAAVRKAPEVARICGQGVVQALVGHSIPSGHIAIP